ncbi:MAG: RNA 2',3'-cyclic phosphodiesterase [Bacteroidales bacterium]|jgi:2'-5' RNA ligase|nr:RNA 2',3'-cyclic phosphodiesterase [Bacteroidales bacterium]
MRTLKKPKNGLFIGISIGGNKEFEHFCHNLRTCSTKLDKMNWVKEDLMHLSIKHIGNQDNSKMESIVQIMQDVACEINSFELIFNKLGVFGSTYAPRILWVGIEEEPNLKLLFTNLQKSLKKMQIAPNIYSFIPHVSIARIHKIEDKRLFFKKIEEYNKTNFAFHFKVKEIALIDANLEKIEPVYTAIATVKLKNSF